MNPYRFILFVFCLSISFSSISQTSDSLVNKEIREAEAHLEKLRQQEIAIKKKIELLKFESIQQALLTAGYPKGHDAVLFVVKHAAYITAYDEKLEQARWVAHIILPDIAEGNFGRSNDFRIDSLVPTGTPEKYDYWNSGYDRGHLAPSADFRWSAVALSESYFYSNISPQRPELNRERWAELEDLLRAYVMINSRKLFVITGPVVSESKESIGVKNKVIVPKYFFKATIDPSAGTGIAFIMPNGICTKTVLEYAVPIDSVEKLTGLNLFPNLNPAEEKKMESVYDLSIWRIAKEEGNFSPLNPEELPKGKFNTSQAKYHNGAKITVCGKVVSTKYTEKSGATFINLDRKFPDQIFTVQIWKDARTNFSYAPENELQGKTICVTGKITVNQGVATMTIQNENAIEILED